jgi:hypothetical protein
MKVGKAFSFTKCAANPIMSHLQSPILCYWRALDLHSLKSSFRKLKSFAFLPFPITIFVTEVIS